MNTIKPSRRVFLGGAAAAGIGALLPSLNSVSAQTGNNARRIDVHHHFTCPEWLEFTRKHNQVIRSYRGPNEVLWSAEKDLADMDKSGTAVALNSVTSPGFWFGEVHEVRTVVRQCNDYAARLTMDHRGRFGNMASIPLSDTEGALREIEYAFDTLKADGIAVFSNYRDKWLGHPSFRPVYEELNRRKAIVFVHPIAGACCVNLVQDVNDNIVEFGGDSTRTIASLIYSGTTTRFPDIRWIFSHGGGVMPMVIERFLLGSQAEIVPGIVTKGQDGPPPANVPQGTLAEIRKMHFDTAQIANPVGLRALRQVVPVSQIVFGTDYWYRTAEESSRGLTTAQVFNSAELRMINRGNAERLFPKFRS